MNFIPLGGIDGTAPFDRQVDKRVNKINTKKFGNRAVGPRGPRPIFDKPRIERRVGATKGLFLSTMTSKPWGPKVD